MLQSTQCGDVNKIQHVAISCLSSVKRWQYALVPCQHWYPDLVTTLMKTVDRTCSFGVHAQRVAGSACLTRSKSLSEPGSLRLLIRSREGRRAFDPAACKNGCMEASPMRGSAGLSETVYAPWCCADRCSLPLFKLYPCSLERVHKRLSSMVRASGRTAALDQTMLWRCQNLL